MHSYSKRARRQGFEALTGQDFMRFLLRWQHMAPDTQLVGEPGLLAILEQLQGFEAAASAWETEPVRAPPAALRSGVAGWVVPYRRSGVAAPDTTRLRRSRETKTHFTSPSRVTPTAVVLRNDLGWLLAAARGVPVEQPVLCEALPLEVLDVLRATRSKLCQRPGKLRRTGRPPRSNKPSGMASPEAWSCATDSPPSAH